MFVIFFVQEQTERTESSGDQSFFAERLSSNKKINIHLSALSGTILFYLPCVLNHLAEFKQNVRWQSSYLRCIWLLFDKSCSKTCFYIPCSGDDVRGFRAGRDARAVLLHLPRDRLHRLPDPRAALPGGAEELRRQEK